jgi:hypothetical protein
VDRSFFPQQFQIGSDHELIRFSIFTDNTETVINPAIQSLYKLEKADWEKSEQIIHEKSIELSEFIH